MRSRRCNMRCSMRCAGGAGKRAGRGSAALLVDTPVLDPGRRIVMTWARLWQPKALGDRG